MKIIWLNLLISISLCSCGLSQNRKDEASLVINKLDSIGIKFFKDWDYSYRGFGVRTWYRSSGNESFQYSCRWRDDNDSIELLITKINPFLKDFGINFTPNPLYEGFRFRKFRNCSKILGMEHSGRLVEVQKIDSVDYTTFYTIENPFILFEKHINIFDRLGIIETRQDLKNGGIIQFYLSNGYVLTYLPNDIEKNENYKENLKMYLEKGVIIKPNWNYRKKE